MSPLPAGSGALPAPDTDDGQVRPFADVLRELGQGATHDELSRLLRELTAAVVDTGKKGQLILKVTVAPLKGVDGGITITDGVASTIPKLDRKAAIFYADRDGNPVRNDPRQLTLDGPLREVAAATQPEAVRAVGGPTAIREAP